MTMSNVEEVEAAVRQFNGYVSLIIPYILYVCILITVFVNSLEDLCCADICFTNKKVSVRHVSLTTVKTTKLFVFYTSIMEL